MARRKNAPESVKIKHGLSERLRELRTELFGERGGPDLARRLGIPVRTWYNYETGVTVPAEIILRIVELTSVEPVWLLRGDGPRFRERAMEPVEGPGQHLAATSVPALLRAALLRLEAAERTPAHLVPPAPLLSIAEGRDGEIADSSPTLVDACHVNHQPLTPADGNSYHQARQEWQDAASASRHLRVTDDQMAPVVARGAIVAFAESEFLTPAFDGKLVVARVDGREIVRWFQHCGRYGLLRAENPVASPPTVLVDLDHAEEQHQFHRVLWISTPH